MSRPSLTCVDLRAGDVWERVLAEAADHDVYHLRQYHALAEACGEGSPLLLVYREGAHLLLFPLLVRDVREAPRLRDWQGELHDATSVYGYPGPVYAGPGLTDEVREGFRAAMGEELRRRRIVTVFSRLNPLIPMQRDVLRGTGELQQSGTTVSIDLSLPEEAQLAQYRTNHRRDIARLRKLGAECRQDPARLLEFAAIYRSTMSRVGASPGYLFSDEYFVRLMKELGEAASLWMVTIGDEALCGGIFFHHRGRIQYHLGGTHEAHVNRGPTKLMFDAVRAWGSSRGMRSLHLGGGLGGREDSLFAFKAGFSDLRHEFWTFRWVLDEEAYEGLRRAAGCEETVPGSSSGDAFFPAYRKPL